MELHRDRPLALLGGPDHDPVDQRADRVAGLRRLVACQMLLELGNCLPIDRRIVGGQTNDIGLGRRGNQIGQPLLLALELLEAAHERLGGIVILLDPLDELDDPGAHLGEVAGGLAAPLVAVAIGLFDLLLQQACIALDQLGRQQLLADARQDPLFKLARPDGAPVQAGALAEVDAAPPASTPGGDIIPAAFAAMDQFGQQIDRALRASERVPCDLELRVALGPSQGLPRFDALPELVRDDPGFRHRGDFPEAGIIVARPPLEAALAIGHLDVATAIEDALANIEPVVQNAFAALDISRQGRRVPADAGLAPARLGARRRDAALVKQAADLLQRQAIGIHFEDVADQLGTGRVDRDPVLFGPVGCEASDFPDIAERAAPGETPASRFANEAAPRPIGNLLAMLLADDAFEAEHEIVDRSAAGQRMKRDVVPRKQLLQILKVLLVAAETIDILDDHNLGAARFDVPDHGLKPRPLERGAGDPLIGAVRDEMHAL